MTRLYPSALQRLYPVHGIRLFPNELGEYVPPAPPTEEIAYVSSPSGGVLSAEGLSFSPYVGVEVIIQDVIQDTDSSYLGLQLMISGAWVTTGYRYEEVSVFGGGTGTQTEISNTGAATFFILSDATAGWKPGNDVAECFNGNIQLQELDTSNIKTMNAFMISSNEGANFVGIRSSGALYNTGAVTGIKIFAPLGANITNGSMLITGLLK